MNVNISYIIPNKVPDEMVLNMLSFIYAADLFNIRHIDVCLNKDKETGHVSSLSISINK